MSFQRVRQFKSQDPQTAGSTSQFGPRPFSVQAPQHSPTQEEIDNQAFNQHNLEAIGLQLKEKSGTITPIEQARLGVLQAKMDTLRMQRLEQAQTQPNLLEILIRNPPTAQTADRALPVQPKLRLGQANDQHERVDRRATPGVNPLQASAAAQPIQRKWIQRQEESDEALQTKPSNADSLLQPKETTTGNPSIPSPQPRPNQTGLPDNLKTGIESLSGIGLDDVRVHYNSPKPDQLQAAAYTQGTEIHVAPGQEKHLPHEAWHVVQQMQGRVNPTMQMQGAQINNDRGLEHEADVMGEKALGSVTQSQGNQEAELGQGKSAVLQRQSPEEDELLQGKFEVIQLGNRLYVGNLSFNTTPETLQAAFSAYGEVREVSMPTDRETGQLRGFAFVTLGTSQSAAAAIAGLDGAILDGRPLRVNEAQERPPRNGGRGGFGQGGGGYGGGGGGRGGGGGGRGGRGGGRDRY